MWPTDLSDKASSFSSVIDHPPMYDHESSSRSKHRHQYSDRLLFRRALFPREQQKRMTSSASKNPVSGSVAIVQPTPLSQDTVHHAVGRSIERRRIPAFAASRQTKKSHAIRLRERRREVAVWSMGRESRSATSSELTPRQDESLPLAGSHLTVKAHPGRSGTSRFHPQRSRGVRPWRLHRYHRCASTRT